MMRRLGVLLGVSAILILLWINERGANLATQADSPSMPASKQLEFAPALDAAAKREVVAEPPEEAESEEDDWELIEIEEAEHDISEFPDPPQKGNCELVIDFIDAVTGEAVAGEVKLYRLDAPDNELWTEGDQLQLHAHTQGNELIASQIPEGRYRAYPLFARLHAPTPPAFEVEGYTTRISQKVEMPAKHLIHLQLFRSDGVLYNSQIAAVEFRRLADQPNHFGKPEPDWLTRRELKDEDIGYFTEYSFFSLDHPAPWAVFPYQANGYSLWQISGDNRDQPIFQRLEARVNLSPANTLRLKPSLGGSYAAVYVDPKDLQQALVFPASYQALDLSHKFEVQCNAISLAANGGRSLEEAWKELIVSIQLKVEGLQPVQLDWRPSHGPLPRIWLQWAQASD